MIVSQSVKTSTLLHVDVNYLLDVLTQKKQQLEAVSRKQSQFLWTSTCMLLQQISIVVNVVNEKISIIFLKPNYLSDCSFLCMASTYTLHVHSHVAPTWATTNTKNCTVHPSVKKLDASTLNTELSSKQRNNIVIAKLF